MIRTLHSLSLILGILLMVAACGSDVPGGGSATDASTPAIDADLVCTGCIDSFGTCVSGESESKCGGNANACVTCTTGDVCIDLACETPPSCNADKCAGCCLPDSTCAVTASQTGSQCGADGLACTSCASGICEQGVCVEACSPETCSGCCNGPTINDCLEIGNDQSALACGSEGMACAACGGNATCTQGSCVDTTCNLDCPDGCCDGATCRDGDVNNLCGTGGEACFSCGMDQTCSSGLCVVDPDSLWNFVIVSYDVPTTDADGDPWDAGGGAPDVYINVTLGVDTAAPVTGATTPVKNQFTQQLSPPNGEIVISNVAAAKILDSILLDVNDDDAFIDDDMISIMDSMPPEALFGGTLFQLSSGGFTIRFRVVKP